MRDIQVDDDVFAVLQREAEPLVDTPNSVLRRLLGVDGPSRTARGVASGAAAPEHGNALARPEEAPRRAEGPVRPEPDTSGPAEARRAAAAPGGSGGGASGRRGHGGKKRQRRASKRPTDKRRASIGSLLPEQEYELPLLRALAEIGGSGPVSDVVERAGEKLDGKLTELERQELSSGQVRWKSRMQFVRLRLIERGLMSKDTPRGVWALTDQGRAYVDSQGEAAGAAKEAGH